MFHVQPPMFRTAPIPWRHNGPWEDGRNPTDQDSTTCAACHHVRLLIPSRFLTRALPPGAMAGNICILHRVPGEIKRRELELDPQASPEEVMSREVELGCESWTSFASGCYLSIYRSILHRVPGEIKRREVELDPQGSPEEVMSREMELGWEMEMEHTSTYTSRPSYTDIIMKDACHNHIQHTSTYTSRPSYTDMIMKDACHDVNHFRNNYNSPTAESARVA